MLSVSMVVADALVLAGTPGYLQYLFQLNSNQAGLLITIKHSFYICIHVYTYVEIGIGIKQ